MVVYALLGCVDYEGQSLLGVYASREDAVAARQACCYDYYDYYVLESRVVGAPADFDVEQEDLE